VEGHRAPLADLLNQLSTSTDCCRALHFVTISDSDDNSSDSDASNDNPALFVDYATAAVISSPPVNISPPVEPTSGSVVRGVSPMEQHRVRSSHGLFDDIDGSSTTISPPPRTEHGSTIPPCAAGTQGQHICELRCRCCLVALTVYTTYIMVNGVFLFNLVSSAFAYQIIFPLC